MLGERTVLALSKPARSMREQFPKLLARPKQARLLARLSSEQFWANERAVVFVPTTDFQL